MILDRLGVPSLRIMSKYNTASFVARRVVGVHASLKSPLTTPRSSARVIFHREFHQFLHKFLQTSIVCQNHGATLFFFFNSKLRKTPLTEF